MLKKALFAFKGQSIHEAALVSLIVAYAAKVTLNASSKNFWPRLAAGSDVMATRSCKVWGLSLLHVLFVYDTRSLRAFEGAARSLLRLKCLSGLSRPDDRKAKQAANK